MFKSVKRIFIQFSLIFLLYIALPIYLSFGLKIIPLKLLLLFFLANFFIVFYLIKNSLNKKYDLEYKIQRFEERYNILADRNLQEVKSNCALKIKIDRYNSLKNVVEEINQSLDIDNVAGSFTSSVFSIIADKKGACLLYLIDKHKQTLSLFKTQKEDKQLIIKDKQGDIFDYWVLRHNSPLLIEDVRKDFRFDLEKIKTKEIRPFLSLISSPFISEQRFSGLLRLDSEKEHSYTQDDLRFLVTICDLGAVALENSELFQETQELAIRDGLTSLYTKQYFGERLKEECIRSSRQKSSFSLLMLDIDYFKDYNDKYGHTVGDIVLKKISQNITEHLREYSPVIGRFGGEEFSVLLPGTNKKKALRLASQLRKKIEKDHIALRRRKTNVTISIGVASFPEDAQDQDEIIMKADKAMYQAKQKGRNRVCCI